MTIESDQKVSELINVCKDNLPSLEAIYLFGSWGTEYERKGGDVDIALLLPFREAREQGSLYTTTLHQMLERLFSKDVDLINLRCVPTVLQKEVIGADRRIYCADTAAADEFEMLTISFYQKLNEERRGILKSFYETGRAVQL